MTQINKRIPSNPKQAAKRIGPIDKAFNSNLFKALGDPTRLKLLACLAKCGRSCTVTEVAECCDIDFSVVSRHLALLARTGVVEASKNGRTVYYRVRYEELSTELRAVADALDGCCVRGSKSDRCGC